MKKILRTITPKLRINFLLIGLLLLATCLQAQSVQETDKKLKKETNKILKTAEEELGENDFASAEASYRKAVSKNETSATARYNMANMYYGKEKPAQATSRYKQAAKVADTKEDKHDVFHNLGNSLMNQKKYQEAIDAYKNALRNNPTDEETRYNLALAKQKLEKDQQENKDKKDNKEDKKDQDKKDQDKEKKEGDKGEKEKKDQGEDKEKDGGDKEDQPKKEPEKKDENGEPKNKKDQEDKKGDQEKEQPQQPQPGQLSPQQIKSLLDAMNNEEKKVQDKMNAEKAKGAKTRTAKDW